jgi:hypothetical protein
MKRKVEKKLVNFMNPWIHKTNHPNNQTRSEKLGVMMALGLERVGTRFVFIEI